MSGCKNGYREIFLYEKEHPTLEPVTCRGVRNSALKTNFFKKRVKRC
jgi:hypothetical protein